MRSLSLSTLTILIALSPLAASSSARADDRAIAIRCGQMLDVRAGKMVDNAVIVVQGERIVDAGAKVAPPPGAVVIDLPGATVLPGLIDTHTHVFLRGDVTTEEYEAQILRESIPYRTIQATVNARLALEQGFTTIRDLETEGAMYADVDVKNAIERGLVPGPRMQVATRALAITGAYPLLGFPPEVTVPTGVQVVDGPDECRRAVREQLKYGADWIKVYADRAYFLKDDHTLSSKPNFTPEEMHAIIDEAHRQGHKVAAHAMAPPGISIALGAGIDTIEHGVGLDEESIRTMVARGVYLAPTLTAMLYVAPGRTQAGAGIWGEMPAIAEHSFRQALAAGVKIAFGTDAGAFPWTEPSAAEFEHMVRFGMTPLAAIRSATVVAAELLGWRDRIGSVEKGYLADIVAFPADPLKDVSVLRHPIFVMKGGKVFRTAATAAASGGDSGGSR